MAAILSTDSTGFCREGVTDQPFSLSKSLYLFPSAIESKAGQPEYSQGKTESYDCVDIGQIHDACTPNGLCASHLHVANYIQSVRLWKGQLKDSLRKTYVSAHVAYHD